jgi:hypothetical protein
MVLSNVIAVGRSVRVRLPWANAVFLAAEFNRWSTTTTPMRSIGDGAWEIQLSAEDVLGRFCFFALPSDRPLGRVVNGGLAEVAS